MPQEKESCLSGSITVTQYREMEKEKDKKAIARFLQERFEERYLAPFDANKRKHGFIMMASACLMIEALESFWQGWRQSPNSALAFCQFFERSNRFNAIRGLSGEFYRHVRCGIMHQAETTGGWHIRRDLRLLFDKSTKTIDATVFLKEMRASLFEYCKALERASWQDDVWIKLRKKMKSVCANTERSA